MSTYLLDTNIISLLVRKMPLVDARFRNELRDGSEFLLPALVDYESRRGFLWRNATTIERKYEAVIAGFQYAELTRRTWTKAAEFWAFSRSNVMPLPDADLIIAAQAITSGAVLVTNNERHFNLFVPQGLQIEDWTK